MDADLYSSTTGLLYIFNLIVGTGALTLPKAFQDAGYVLSIVFIICLGFFSYMTATFVIESMSLCSSIIQWKRVETMKNITRIIQSAVAVDSNSESESSDEAEDSLMLPQEFVGNFPSEPQKVFNLDVKSEMATTVFNQYEQFLFYFCLCLYLYGDLTIYSAAVSKTLVDVVCTVNGTGITSDFCWESYNYTRVAMYQIFLCTFLMIFAPFVFFKVTKTKYWQMITSITRWLAFSGMITLSIIRIADPTKIHGVPTLAKISGLPALLGTSVYSFMCHHSLPGLIATMREKKNVYRNLAFDYIAIIFIYLTLSLTAVFAFPTIKDLYSLNFYPDQSVWKYAYFFTLFPLFTLTASFPIISVTLKNNLQAMFYRFQWRFLHSAIIPLVAVVPPVLIAMSTANIEMLVGITGSFAGVIIQYIIPAIVVMQSRKQLPPELKRTRNSFSSPFKSNFWPILVLIWAAFCLIFVIIDIILHHKF